MSKTVFFFLILQVIASVSFISAQETLYQDNIPLFKKDGGQKITSIDIEIIYHLGQRSYILQLGKGKSLKDTKGNQAFLWFFSKETEGKDLLEKWSGIVNGKKEKFNALLQAGGYVNFSFSGEKRLASKENIPFSLSEEAPEEVNLMLFFYAASIDKKNNEQLTELLPVNIKFNQYKEKLSSDVTTVNNNTDATQRGNIVFEVDTDIVDTAELIEEDLNNLIDVETRKKILDAFITETNGAIQQIYDEINQTEKKDISQVRKDSLELVSNALNEKVVRRKTNQSNINILEIELEIEDKFSQFDLIYNQINKKLMYWDSTIAENEKSKPNWLIILGACFAFIMMLFPIITQINSKREVKKQQKQQQKTMEEEKFQQLMNDEDIPGI